jgi:hypothetical protein
MLALLAVLALFIIIALFAALDWAAVKWGANSRKAELLEHFEGR